MAFPGHRPNIIMKADGTKADSNTAQGSFLKQGMAPVISCDMQGERLGRTVIPWNRALDVPFPCLPLALLNQFRAH